MTRKNRMPDPDRFRADPGGAAELTRLEAGARSKLSDLDSLGFACLSSETWLEALHCFMRFQRLLRYASQVRQSLHLDAERAILRIERTQPAEERTYRSLVDEWLGNWRGWLGSSGIRFESVRSTLAEVADIRPYEHALGCEVVTSQTADEIHLSLSTLHTRPDLANSRVHGLMVAHCTDSLAALEQKDILIERVKREVAALDYHRVDSDRIAHRLRTSARTVRRNLASQGTSFHDVVMEQRMTLAKRYLKDPGLPIKQISSSLGYSDISSFHRAFRSHTGLTPGQFRGNQGA
jgi:AraC-like DNA-binding protein